MDKDTHSWVSLRKGLEAFTQQLYAEAILRGMLNAREMLIIANGTIWIRNLAADRFKGARQRVDSFHVKEHLHELAHTLYGKGTDQARQWLRPLLDYLDRRKDGPCLTLARNAPTFHPFSGCCPACGRLQAKAESPAPGRWTTRRT